MSKHKNNTDPQSKTTKEQLKRLSIATIAALGLISTVGAVIPNETVAGHAARETEHHTTPLGYYFGGHRNSKLDLFVEDTGQRIIDYANLHPKKASLAGKEGPESTGMLHIRDGRRTVIISADREGGIYSLRSWGVSLRAGDVLSYAELSEQTNEKNDAGNTWDTEVGARTSIREDGIAMKNNLEAARARKVPLEELEEADRRAMYEVDRILDEMGI